MRPLRMKLTNFGSYASIELLLEALNLAAIVGDNGAGKSTLLDAILVALFGSKAGSLDGFVRQGTDGFMLEFDWVSGTTEYRVVREQGKTQKASLFALTERDGKREEWHPVCEPKVRDVDEAIISLVGDYASFTMAHHLRQGQLDAFPSQDPAERKAWIGRNVPGISIYPVLEERAKKVVATYQRKADDEQARISALGAGEDVDTLTASLATAEQEQHAAEAAIEQVEVSMTAQRQAEERWVALDGERSHAAAILAACESEVTNTTNRLAQLRAKVAAAANGTAPPPCAPDVAALEAEHAELVQRKAAAETALARLSGLNRAMVAKREASYAAHARLMAAHDVLKREGEELAAFDLQRAEFMAHREDCPFCGAAPEHQDTTTLERSYDARREELLKRVETAEGEAQRLEAENVEAGREFVAATKEHEDARKAAPMEADAQLGGRIATLASAIETARESVRLMAAYRESQAALTGLREQITATESELAAANERCAGAREALEAAEKAVVLLGARPDTTALSARLRELNDARTAAAADVSALTQRLTAAKARAGELAAAKIRLDAALSMAQDATILAKAYGKNGIQARLIEGAVDEIAEFTNAFLGEFTDGLTVEFRQQRENKSAGGGVRETLDIYVADAAGERPLERFSGGEKTRVHFAIAAGISHFLSARQSGTVGSFVVDEPEFLDRPGLEELLKCLHVVAKTVPLVMLVSHLDVTDALPQQIEVRKGANGSTLKVVA